MFPLNYGRFCTDVKKKRTACCFCVCHVGQGNFSVKFCTQEVKDLPQPFCLNQDVLRKEIHTQMESITLATLAALSAMTSAIEKNYE